jgi:DNA-binding response OmpR family regulator
MNHKILVVDDDEAILDVVKIILTNEGYEVETHTSGKQLYSRESNLPSLIILDILLSGEDGRDICAYLKGKESTKNIPIILFSAHSHADISNTLPPAAYDYFISKPFDVDDLIKVVKQFVA